MTCMALSSILTAGLGGQDLDEEFAASLREQMEASLQHLGKDFVPEEADEHGRQLWTRCEALTAGKSYFSDYCFRRSGKFSTAETRM